MSKRMTAMFVAAAVIVLQPAFGSALQAQAREGIKVHGHWAIDVRQPDGTLVSHAEFENALLLSGSAALASILSRQETVVRWVVVLSTNGPAFAQSGLPARLYEAALGDFFPVSSPSSFGTLTVARYAATVVLKGTATAAASGELRDVATQLTSLSEIGQQSTVGFSGTALPSPVSLAAGQIVQVTVTLSFS